MDYKRVLILRFTNGMSSREIAETTGYGKTTVNDFLKRFRECDELSYPLSEEVTNEFIAGCLYRKAGNPVNSDLYRDFDPEDVHRALAKKGEVRHGILFPCLAANYGPDWPGITALLAGDYGYLQ